MYWRQQILVLAICLHLTCGIAFAKCPGCPGVKPFGYLFLYNIMFVIPLALVIASSAHFVNSQKVARFYSRYIGVFKLLTAFFFFFLSAYMFGLLV